MAQATPKHPVSATGGDLPRVADTESAPSLTDWFTAVGERFGNSAKLILAETRLAVATFILMIFCVVLAAGAVLFAWALLVLFGVQALALAGFELLAAIGLLCIAHVLIALGLWLTANRLARHMEFRATRELFGDDS
ncbi:hypothetical protein [Elongatibacter sediminis]|uniref:Phage holin family protein n=1 Tax=Elongatibacter sediminis TaxID=3119006 RepID=A0AAW9R8J8_9GAMM